MVATGWILIVAFIVFVLLLLAKDEYHDRKEKKRRMEQRAEIKWSVDIHTDQGTISGQTVNISASGALICIPEQFSMNEIVNLSIKPPIRATLDITAEVVRTQVQCCEDDVAFEGAALRFIIISEKDKQFLSFTVFDYVQKKSLTDQRTEQPAVRDLRL
jgi:c-di-GMP-binding flagellar brake protein YcgR